MEPDVMRLYSSSPPPMEDAEEDDDQDDFGDFGAFSTASAGDGFGEPDAPGHASFATSPPELLNGLPAAEEARREAKANGAAPAAGHPPLIRSRDRSEARRPGPRAAGDGAVANGFAASDVRPGPRSFVGDRAAGDVDGPEAEFADFAAFSDTGRHGDAARRGCAAGRTASDREAAAPLPTTCDPEAERHAADFAPDRASGVHTNGRRDSAGERAEGCADVNGARADAVCPRGIDELCVHVADGVGGRGVSLDDASVDGDRVDVLAAAGDGRASDTETETSLGRPLSTEAPEDYGDVSATGSAPSPPPLREENATPADHSQLDDDDDEEFGDFGDAAGAAAAADFTAQEACPPPARDRFGDLDGPPRPDADGEGGASFADARWSAFGEESEGESWAAFRTEAAAPAEAPWSRVEKLLEASFPLRDGAPPAAEGRVASLQTLVEARRDDAGSALGGGGGVWRRLRDIHEAVGLGHQWGGSYCNKTLLGCLGIDTRNILFTGQKKQPLIVPVYAASLGMLEPTKEPAKPVSAAEMIASIAQAAAAAPDGASDVVVQEPLPPVRFDWSSSGLTNPLDASGGSFLLNLDFFGPVDDSGSSCSPAIPGVDPELVELTTAKMEPGGGGATGAAGGRVVDAFARLMSTMDKTSTSTRRMRKEERLSSEAAEVICGLPDLSFMTAKVLMFPATLMPLASQATPD